MNVISLTDIQCVFLSSVLFASWTCCIMVDCKPSHAGPLNCYGSGTWHEKNAAEEMMHFFFCKINLIWTKRAESSTNSTGLVVKLVVHCSECRCLHLHFKICNIVSKGSGRHSVAPVCTGPAVSWQLVQGVTSLHTNIEIHTHN